MLQTKRKFHIWEHYIDLQLIKDDQYGMMDDEGSSRGKNIFGAKRQIIGRICNENKYDVQNMMYESEENNEGRKTMKK